MYYCKGAPYFARTLKHKRHEISVENLIVSLDVEEKARAKDATRKERVSLTPRWCRRNPMRRAK
jgi:D-ribose pyranose/furanose isomerase RbsD